MMNREDIVKTYSIYENGEPFGVVYPTKQRAIRVYLEHIENEEKLDDYWKEKAKQHRENLEKGLVQVLTTTKIIRTNEEFETIKGDELIWN